MRDGFWYSQAIKTYMNILPRKFVLLFCLLIAQIGFGQNIKVLVNHLGYEQDAPKRAVILGHAGDDVTKFKVIDCSTGKNVLSGPAVKVGPVDQWKDWYFWTADFQFDQNRRNLSARMRHQPGRSAFVSVSD